MSTTPTTDIHTRINARASIIETRIFWGQLCHQPADTPPLVLTTLVVQGDILLSYALSHPRREYDEERRQSYTAYARGPLNEFLSRFSHTTRKQAQQLADTYTIYL